MPQASLRRLTLPLLGLLLLTACGSNGDGGGGNPPPAGPLTGAPNSLAKAAIQDVDTGDTYTQAEISISPAGEEIIRTKLQIVFRPEATVGQVNTLLTDLNAAITTSIAGLETVVVRIPDPGTLDALDVIVTRIETEAFVWFVSQAMLPTLEALPENIPPSAAQAISIRHHLAVGAAGAWNARGAIVNLTRVVIWDYFGDGAPNDDLDYSYSGDSAAADFATGALVDHGYHVVGIIAGRFGGPTSLRGYVTGLLPGPIELSVIDGQSADPLDGKLRLLIRLQALQGGTALVNISQGVSASCNTPVTCRPDEEWRLMGAWWVQAMRQLGLENRVLILKSAGNIHNNGNDDARYNYFPATAALSPDLVDGNGNPLTPLTNTLVVENVRAQGDFPYDGPRCLSAGSWRGGHVGAIGSGVWSFTNAASTADYLSGTSMAAPQVAGLAAYLLAIRPELTPQEVVAIILDTTAPVPVEVSPDCSAWPTPASIIQPYRALLALDRANQGPEQVPVRRALLDINDSDTFTGDDIVAFLLAFETAQGDLDFGRADLNNDGRTGGEGARPFDLNMDRTHAASGVTAAILGQSHAFDETALTDIAILCYYAYSPLYAGSPEARDLHLEPYLEQGECGEVSEFSVSASLPARMLVGQPEPLVVTVTDRDGPVAGASVVVTAEGGTAGGGSTDAEGLMRSQALISEGSVELIVTIQVFVDGVEVGELVKQAQAALPANVEAYRDGFYRARVSGATTVNITGGAPLGPPGATTTNENNGNTFTWTWDTGYPPGTTGVSQRMHRFTGNATGSGVNVELYVKNSSAEPTFMTMELSGFYRVEYYPAGSVPGPFEVIAGNYPELPQAIPGTVEMVPGALYVVYVGSADGELALDVYFTQDPAPP